MKLMFRFALLLLSGTMLSGCGSMADPRQWFDNDDANLEPAELVDFTATVEPQEIWNQSIGEASEDLSRLKPTVHEGILYVANAEGELFAMEANTGRQIWMVETGLSVSAGPGAGEGLLVLGTVEGKLVAFDSRTGEQLWSQGLSSEILAVPAIGSGIVVVHTGDGRLFGLNAVSGEQIWLYDHKVPVLTLRGSSSPVISGSSVYCGLAGGKMVALSLDAGLVEWESHITLPTGRSDLERMVDVDTDPLIYSGTVYGGAYQGDVAALGEASGKVFWKRKVSVYNNMAVNWQQLALTDAQGFVWSLDPDTGSARWRQEALMNRQLSAPALLGDFVVVGDFEGYLHWLSVEDGSFAARQRVGDAIVAAPLVVGDILYVLSTDGRLTALKLPE